VVPNHGGADLILFYFFEGRWSGAGAIVTEPGGEDRGRMKGQTVWAQRVFAPPVPSLGDRGCLSGVAALSLAVWRRPHGGVLFFGHAKKRMGSLQGFPIVTSEINTLSPKLTVTETHSVLLANCRF